jgi:chorismate lyase/3-hydroxybenzoate synthase
MEKTQTNAARVSARIDPGLAPLAAHAAAFSLDYLTPAEFLALQARCDDRLLGAIAFGAQPPRSAPPDCPYAWVDMPVLDTGSMFEVWTSAQPVVREKADGLAAARNSDILFGCVRLKLDCKLDAASYLAYSRIFDFIDRRGYTHLVRAWNYIPQINAFDDGLERYVRFNVGRHDAFSAKGRVIGTGTPAASALGSRGDNLVIYFLAAKQAGQLVENPRQTSAFNYPSQYGPRSPTFARAMLVESGGELQLFVSGTSSIVGHATLHAGNAAAQAAETVANIRAVIAHAQLEGLDAAGQSARFMLKAYVRRSEDLATVRNCLTRSFGPACTIAYLQADVCRADLLLEVEATCLNEAPPAA